ncbi:DUF2752 domain-containing protein [Pedobacter cryotolerans]|uniref:DUF2752 domain-containing protein n=1 Tax=Pedobacter cryotolerans TaxID=2571270 RepID=A0A4U1CES2_9SPHI|nr:DUF2752 domain-containing protein [Pedobacter cryotolerans]
MLDRNKELINAVKICWIIISTFSIVIILIFTIVNPTLILNSTPTCTARINGGSCILCGSTRAFIAISNFEFRNAYEFNKISLLLYILLIINSLLFLKYVFFLKFKYKTT